MRNFRLRVLASFRARRQRRKLGAWGALAQFGVDSRMRKRMGRMENYWLLRMVVSIYAAMSVFAGFVIALLQALDQVQRSTGRVLPEWMVSVLTSGISLAGLFVIVRYVFVGRRFAGAGSVLLDLKIVVRALEDLGHLQEWRERDPLYLRSRNVRLRAMRAKLRTSAWSISRQMAILHGLEVSERSDAKAAVLGRWICWASEDPFDSRRTRDALQVCAEAVIHFQGPLRFAPPKLALPPKEAKLIKPRKSQRMETLGRTAWRRFVVVIPILATVVGMVTQIKK